MTERYATIVADPPWHYGEEGTGAKYTAAGRKTVGLPYRTMALEEIEALPISELAAPGAHLYLWTTNRYLEAAFGVARSWGFAHVATLVWCKPHGALSGGVFHSNVEFILHCRAAGPSFATPARIGTRWFQWPRGPHSAKPEGFLDLVEHVSPAPYLELFARRNRLGWHTWGDQALGHVAIPGQLDLDFDTA
jgi:N6-adenosine-specific RNA methylase IME4